MIQHVTDIPKLYIKLKGWEPPPAPLLVENAITLFEKQLKLATHQNTLSLRNKTPNLTKHTQPAKQNTKFNSNPATHAFPIEKIYGFHHHANG